MEPIIAVVAALFVGLALVSGVLARSVVTAPMLALAAGVLLGPVAGILPTDLEEGGVLLLAQLALAVLLFVDATRVDLRLVRRSGQVPARMLVVGLPLVIALGTLLAVVLLGLAPAAAFILACLLAPTDAALGQSLMTDERVPLRLRQAINVESGLNDGLVVPFLAVALVLAGAEHASGGGALLGEAVQLIGGGTVVGVVVGAVVAGGLRLVDWHTLQPAARQVGTAAVPLVAWASATLVGGNGFVAAFLAGMVLGALVEDAHELVEFAEDTGELLALLTFLVLGAVFVGYAVDVLDVWVVVYAALSLTLVRMLPIALSLLGVGLRPDTIGMLGWFGPRGLATVVFALEVLELGQAGVLGQGDRLFGIAAVVVVASVLLHGLSARPLVSAYVRRLPEEADVEQMPELAEVAEVPTRRGRMGH